MEGRAATDETWSLSADICEEMYQWVDCEQIDVFTYLA